MKLIIFLLVSLSLQSQSYFTIGTEIDPRNAIFGSDVNKPSYNGFHTLGFTSDKFRVELFYEHFKEIEYESVGLQSGILLNVDRFENFKIPVLIQLSTVHRPNALTPSLGIVSGIEYHLNRFIFVIMGEAKYRTDFEKQWNTKNRMIYSGRIGLKFKL